MGLAALTAEAFGEQGQPRVPVPAHDGCMSPKRWAELHAQGRPYLLRGCLAETSPRVVESWDDGYLLRHAGAQTNGATRETLGEFLTQPQFGDKEYLTFMNLSQALLEDVGMPAPLLEKHKTHYDKTVLWLAREGWKTGRQSLLHFDPNDNLLHLAFGTKHVLLASPAESAALYSDYAKAEGNSPIDATAVDLSRFPLAASATLHVADMREGDILFIPSNWWHLVTSHPHQRHLALAVQFDTHGRRYAPCRSLLGFSEARVEGQLLREREGKAFVSGLSDHRVPAGAHPSIKGVLLSRDKENERDERDGDFHDEDSRDEEIKAFTTPEEEACLHAHGSKDAQRYKDCVAAAQAAVAAAAVTAEAAAAATAAEAAAATEADDEVREREEEGEEEREEEEEGGREL